MSELIRVEDVSFSFDGALLLDGVSFALSEGDALSIGGKSGCGKSTLLEICASLQHPRSGRVIWEGRDIAKFTHDELTGARQRIGFVFQRHALIHNVGIFDNIALPLRYHSGLSEKDIRAKVTRRMEESGIGATACKFPNELTSGESRLAALARALIMDPRLLIADELTAGGDPFIDDAITGLINRARAESGAAALLACNEIRTVRGLKCPMQILDNGTLFDLRNTAPSSGSRIPAEHAAYQEML